MIDTLLHFMIDTIVSIGFTLKNYKKKLELFILIRLIYYSIII